MGGVKDPKNPLQSQRDGGCGLRQKKGDHKPYRGGEKPEKVDRKIKKKKFQEGKDQKSKGTSFLSGGGRKKEKSFLKGGVSWKEERTTIPGGRRKRGRPVERQKLTKKKKGFLRGERSSLTFPSCGEEGTTSEVDKKGKPAAETAYIRKKTNRSFYKTKKMALGERKEILLSSKRRAANR